MRNQLSIIPAVFIVACLHVPKEEAAMTAPWSHIHIADGAANGFQFTPAESGRVAFVYTPVTAAESSSGLYDGGPPRKEVLAADDSRLSELWALLQKLEADKAHHAPGRNKGTGAISWQAPDGTHSFIVERGAAELNELLALLTRFGTSP